MQMIGRPDEVPILEQGLTSLLVFLAWRNENLLVSLEGIGVVRIYGQPQSVKSRLSVFASIATFN